MKRFVLAVTLTCALSASTLAGEIHTTGAPSPVAPPVPGDMGNGGRADGDQGNGGLTDGTLAAVLAILDLVF